MGTFSGRKELPGGAGGCTGPGGSGGPAQTQKLVQSSILLVSQDSILPSGAGSL